MKNNFYYTAPTDEQFNELKEKAIKIWQTYDDTYGYQSEKVNKIKDMGNISDNFMYIVAMFDSENQTKLSYSLSYETRKSVSDKVKSGGSPSEYNMFIEEE